MTATPLRVLFLTLVATLAAHGAASAQTLTVQQRLTGPNRSLAGFSVDLDGDTLVVGGPGVQQYADTRPGVVLVYRRSGTRWILQQTLGAGDGRDGDGFGHDVAISGTTIVVGAPFGGGSFPQNVHGAVYVFEWNGTAWAQRAKLTASDAATADLFGQDVGIDGNLIVVGAVGANRVADRNGNNLRIGAAYLFERSGERWTEYVLPAPEDRHTFGSSAAVSGNTVCVGMIGYQVTSAFVYDRNALRARLVAPDRSGSDNFGAECAVDGDTIVVGADFADAPAVQQGAAYVFTRSGDAWPFVQKLTSSPGARGDFFGRSLALLGDILVIGAPNNNVPGAAFVYTRSGGLFVLRQRLQPNNGTGGGDLAGADVAVDGGAVVLGVSRLNETVVYGLGTSGPGLPPGQPRSFQAQSSGSTLSLSWAHPSGGGVPTGYVLRARTTGGALIATAPVGYTTSFSAAVANGVYVLTVQATNAAGSGPESDARTVTVPSGATAPPGIPTNLQVTGTGDSATFTWSAATTGGPASGYLLVAGTTPGFAMPLATLTMPATPTSVTVSSIPPGRYYVRVLAQNSGGMSGPSNEVSLTVGSVGVPAAPVLELPVVAGSTVTLSWRAGAGPAPTAYVIGAAMSPGGALFTTAQVSGTSLTVPGVPAGTYYLRVVAATSAGTSPPSNEVTVVVR